MAESFVGTGGGSMISYYQFLRMRRKCTNKVNNGRKHFLKHLLYFPGLGILKYTAKEKNPMSTTWPKSQGTITNPIGTR